MTHEGRSLSDPFRHRRFTAVTHVAGLHRLLARILVRSFVPHVASCVHRAFRLEVFLQAAECEGLGVHIPAAAAGLTRIGLPTPCTHASRLDGQVDAKPMPCGRAVSLRRPR